MARGSPAAGALRVNRAERRDDRRLPAAALRVNRGFTTLVVDHDEVLDAAWRRMEKVRKGTARPRKR